MRNTATLLTLAALTACEASRRSTRPDALFDAAELAEFMGTRAERAARAPYSPLGWPVGRGELVSFERWVQLTREFPLVCGISSPFWVGDMVFGALWNVDGEAWMVARRHDPDAGPPVRYQGHVRQYNYGHLCSRRSLPPHLRDHGPEILHPPQTMTYWDPMNPEPLAIWTRDRWLDGYTGGDR